MKTIETKLFSFSELSPEAKQRVQDKCEPVVYYEDITASLEAIVSACGLQLLDYSYGSYDRSHKVKVRGSDDALSGPRALVWFRRVLLAHGYPKGVEFPGICGFTGLCYDDDIAETIWKSLLSGDDVREAFDSVSYRLCKIVEDEENYLRSEDWLSENDAEIYTEEGDWF